MSVNMLGVADGLSGESAMRQTRFRPPTPAAHIVERERLRAVLDDSRASVVTISGAPGWGKTTAVAEWLAAGAGRPYAWLSVEPGDNLTTSFWISVLGAVGAERTDPLVEATAALTAEHDHSTTVVTPILDRLATAGSPSAIVFDDLHHITDAAIFDQLAYFVEHLPATTRVVLVSRHELPLPVSRWRAEGLVRELREQHLAFDSDEVDRMLAQVSGISLDSTTVDLMERKTGGWALGLSLAARGLRDSPDPGHFVAAFSGQDGSVAGYLTAEVLDQQPRDVQDFLLRASVLDHLDADVCAVVTGQPDAGETLARLAGRHLVVPPPSGQPAVYAFQPMLRDLLSALLERRMPGESPALHRRAAAGFKDRGDVGAAVRHLVAGGRSDEAFALVVETMSVATELLGTDPDERADWLASIPDAAIVDDVDKIINAVHLYCLLRRYDDAQRWLDLGYVVLDETGADDMARARFHFFQGILDGLRGEMSDVVTALGKAIDIFEARGYPDAVMHRAPLFLAHGHWWLDELRTGQNTLDSLERSGLHAVMDDVAVPAISAMFAHERGELRRASGLTHRAIRHSRKHGLDRHYGTRLARTIELAVHIERGHIDDDTLHDLDEHVDIVHSEFHAALVALARIGRARIWTLRGDTSAAAEELLETREVLARRSALGTAFVARLALAEATIAVHNDSVPRARRALDGISPSWRRTLLEAHLAVNTGDTAHATTLLHSVQPTTIRQHIAFHIAQAALRSAEDDPQSALDDIRTALDMGRAEGFCALFFESGTAATESLRELRADLPPSFHQLDSRRSRQSLTTIPTEPLTGAEQAVLELLSSDMTNREIAASLYISLNTLRSHLRSLYRKLGASTRPEALARAAAAGLGPNPMG